MPPALRLLSVLGPRQASFKALTQLLTQEDGTSHLRKVFSISLPSRRILEARVFGKAVVDAAMNASETATKANPNFDAAVEEVFQTANHNGIKITRDLAIRMLEPFF